MTHSPRPDSSFRALFEAHAAFVWRALKRHGVAERDLEDACQEVFLVLHRRHDEFEGRSSLRTWLYGIAVRVALAWRRKGYRLLEQLSESAEEQRGEGLQAEQVEQRQLLSLVEQALAQLSPEKREAFVLYELEGMTMAEVAAALSVPENTALYRFYGARDEIRSMVARTTRLPELRPIDSARRAP